MALLLAVANDEELNQVWALLCLPNPKHPSRQSCGLRAVYLSGGEGGVLAGCQCGLLVTISHFLPSPHPPVCFPYDFIDLGVRERNKKDI